MRRHLAAIAAMTALYSAMVGSLHPVDLVIGALVGTLATALAREAVDAVPDPAELPPRGHGPLAILGFIRAGLRDAAVGSWNTAVWCLAPGRLRPGFRRLAGGDGGHGGVAAWSVLTVLGPNEIPVTFDAATGQLVVHALDVPPDAAGTGEVVE